MKVALIGASGYVGSHILKELVDRGHHVTAIARNTDQIEKNEHILAVQNDVNDSNALAAILKGSDAVISAYNAGWTNPSIYDDYTAGARSIQEAVVHAGIKRFIVIGGAGSLLTEAGTRIVDDPDFPAEIKPGALAAADYYEVIRRSDDLDWTLFSPAIEMSPASPGTRTGTYRTSLDHPVTDHEGRSRLSVEDVAVAIADELEKPQFIKKRFTAAY
ncbi:Cholesterol dehydrogenase [Sphingobacterium spiritivorum]|uniref:Cholesterol dehydrogenase n=1 Tax=Sphingobacterium spiritivorum TaxID=258 RepID=A0A380CWP1_SPHSI|nr:NAD(P)H-binding protein [Sphingobacterium spiritivorum]SUJ29312.1 Cholesterol dehydrogenase [Sphingobacterium spiritivorum]